MITPSLWALEPAAFDQLARTIEDARSSGIALRPIDAALDQPMTLGAPQRSAGASPRVAVVPITGLIFKRRTWLSRMLLSTVTDDLVQAMRAAANDPAIDAILLDVDSPGGEASGIAEAADTIRAIAENKPVVAYVGGMAASAAYWLASAATRIVVGRTAMLGSIGCVASLLDVRGAMTKAGIVQHEIVSSQSPNKRPDPATEDGRAQIQALVDRLAQEFVDAVARFRDVEPSVVVSERFAAGGMKVGADTVAAGMADQVGSLDATLATLNAAAPALPSKTFALGVDPAAEFQAHPALRKHFLTVGAYSAIARDPRTRGQAEKVLMAGF